jgi:rubrerythrin
MVTFSVREVVEQAVQTEKLGKEFYTKMADKFHDQSELKKLFAVLAAQETKHELTFSSLKDRLTGEESEGWDEVTQYLRAIVDSEFFLGKDKCLPSLEHVKKAADAIDFALCFERDTLLYYYGLRETLKEKEIIEAIIKEEKSHIVWLNNLRKSFL